MKRIAIVMALLTLMNLLVAQVGDKKLALLIANSKYDLYPLKYAKSDINYLGKELEKIGFNVLIYSDVNYQEMKACIREYGDSLKANKGAVSFFYFMGHGIQLEGHNYLIPANAQIENENDIMLEAMDIKLVLKQVCPQSNFLSIAIFDAPPKNPIQRFFSKSVRDGFALMNPPINSIIAISSTPLNVPCDRKFNERIYIEALTKAIQVPGIGIYDVFKKVRKRLYEITHGMQIPWETSSFDGQFYFKKD